jgi:hypothetical protein
MSRRNWQPIIQRASQIAEGRTLYQAARGVPLHYSSLLRGKSSIRAVPGAAAVRGYNSEMVSSVRSQATSVSSNGPVSVPSLTLYRRGEPVAGRGAILEINRRGQPMWIE